MTWIALVLLTGCGGDCLQAPTLDAAWYSAEGQGMWITGLPGAPDACEDLERTNLEFYVTGAVGDEHVIWNPDDDLPEPEGSGWVLTYQGGVFDCDDCVLEIPSPDGSFGLRVVSQQGLSQYAFDIQLWDDQGNMLGQGYI